MMGQKNKLPTLDVSVISVRVGKTDFHLKNYNDESTKTKSGFQYFAFVQIICTNRWCVI